MCLQWEWHLGVCPIGFEASRLSVSPVEQTRASGGWQLPVHTRCVGPPPGGESEAPGRVRAQRCAERFLCARREAAQPSEGALRVALAPLRSRAACRLAVAQGRVEQELQPVGVVLLPFSWTAPGMVEPPLGRETLL